MLFPRCLLVAGLTLTVSARLIAQNNDTPEQARAREALRKAMAELNAAPPPRTATAPKPPATNAPTPRVATVPTPRATNAPAPQTATTPPPRATPTPTPRTANVTGEFPAVPPPSPNFQNPSVAPAVVSPAPAVVSPVPAVASPAPAPAANVAADAAKKAPVSAYATPANVELPKAFVGKEAELQDLLNKYKADQITPEEYFKKRAEILARP